MRQKSTTSITVEIQGGLGNQLFQLCAAIVAASRTRRSFILDIEKLRLSRAPGRQRRTFELLDFVTEAEVATLTHAWTQRLKWCIQQVETEQGPCDNVLSRVYPHTDRIVGYFQNYQLVEEASDSLFRRINKSEKFRSLLLGEQRDEIAVHVRCGDYLSTRSRAFHGLTKPQYFAEAIRLAANSTAAERIHIVSDNPQLAGALLVSTGIGSDFEIDLSHQSTAWEDLAILANSRAVVMSNSSFSWWGGYLASRIHNSVVVAPTPWFAKHIGVEQILFGPSWKILDREIY